MTYLSCYFWLHLTSIYAIKPTIKVSYLLKILKIRNTIPCIDPYICHSWHSSFNHVYTNFHLGLFFFCLKDFLKLCGSAGQLINNSPSFHFSKLFYLPSFLKKIFFYWVHNSKYVLLISSSFIYNVWFWYNDCFSRFFLLFSAIYYACCGLFYVYST